MVPHRGTYLLAPGRGCAFVQARVAQGTVILSGSDSHHAGDVSVKGLTGASAERVAETPWSRHWRAGGAHVHCDLPGRARVCAERSRNLLPCLEEWHMGGKAGSRFGTFFQIFSCKCTAGYKGGCKRGMRGARLAALPIVSLHSED